MFNQEAFLAQKLNELNHRAGNEAAFIAVVADQMAESTDAEKTERILSDFFAKFASYIDLNEHLLIDIMLEEIKQLSPALLREVCSFALCLIAKQYANRTHLFNTFYEHGNFSPNHEHRHGENINHITENIRIYVNGVRIDHPAPKKPMPLLSIAALHGNSEIAGLMLTKGANPDRVYGADTKHPGHALFDVVLGEKVHCSGGVCEDGYGKIAKLLLERGADPYTKLEGITAIEFASPSIFARMNYGLSYISCEGPFNIYAPQCKGQIDQHVAAHTQRTNLSFTMPGMGVFTRVVGRMLSAAADLEGDLERRHAL